jgi:FKBP-type peptidyl-prolyl cis-trans isomerase 2
MVFFDGRRCPQERKVSMPAKAGDLVRVHYKGTLSDGTVFDSSEGRDPLEFTLGQGMVIPGFDSAVTGMEVGGNVVRTIPAAEAYGPAREEMVIKIPKDQFPEDMPLELGQELQLQGPGGYLIAQIVGIEEDGVILDANHPLAGEDLTFSITLESIGSKLIIP